MKEKHVDPLWPIAKVFLFLLAFLVIGLGFYRYFGDSNAQKDNSKVVIEKSLYFYDGKDGSVIVKDENGNEISRFSEEAGFARMAIRTLAQERIKQGVGPEKPFRLIARENGRISLLDPVTESQINVDAFGKTNSEVFALLLSTSNSK